MLVDEPGSCLPRAQGRLREVHPGHKSCGWHSLDNMDWGNSWRPVAAWGSPGFGDAPEDSGTKSVNYCMQCRGLLLYSLYYRRLSSDMAILYELNAKKEFHCTFAHKIIKNHRTTESRSRLTREFHLKIAANY